MFIESLNNPNHYPVPITEGKTPDIDLYTFRSYLNHGGNIVNVPTYQVIPKGAKLYGQSVKWNSQYQDYVQVTTRERKIKSIQSRGFNSFSEIDPNQLTFKKEVFK